MILRGVRSVRAIAPPANTTTRSSGASSDSPASERRLGSKTSLLSLVRSKAEGAGSNASALRETQRNVPWMGGSKATGEGRSGVPRGTLTALLGTITRLKRTRTVPPRMTRDEPALGSSRPSCSGTSRASSGASGAATGSSAVTLGNELPGSISSGGTSSGALGLSARTATTVAPSAAAASKNRVLRLDAAALVGASTAAVCWLLSASAPAAVR
jgi:hypothetical protein